MTGSDSWQVDFVELDCGIPFFQCGSAVVFNQVFIAVAYQRGIGRDVRSLLCREQCAYTDLFRFCRKIPECNIDTRKCECRSPVTSLENHFALDFITQLFRIGKITAHKNWGNGSVNKSCYCFVTEIAESLAPTG